MDSSEIALKEISEGKLTYGLADEGEAAPEVCQQHDGISEATRGMHEKVVYFKQHRPAVERKLNITGGCARDLRASAIRQKPPP